MPWPDSSACFADKAGLKLSEIFDTLFKTTEQRKDALIPLEIVTSTLADGKVGSAYSAQALAVKGGTPPYRWSAQDLPSGLVIGETSGIIAGTPNAAGKKDVKITVFDKADAKVTKTVAITINA